MNIDAYQQELQKIRGFMESNQGPITYGLAACILAQLLDSDKDADDSLLAKIYQQVQKVTALETFHQAEELSLSQTLTDFETSLGVGIPVSLLSADTDRVKGYVLESARLPEVRGASWRLYDLNENRILQSVFREKYHLPKECIIYAAGGSLLAIVPSIYAEEICKDIQELYVQTTLAATITAVSHPFSLAQLRLGLNPENPGNRRFGELVEFMAYKLKRAKEEKGAVPLFETIPFARRCQSCDIRPAARSIQIGESRHYLCVVCQKKRDFGRDYEGELLKYLRKHAPSYWNGVKPPPDLEAISGTDGYIGVIYADGNNIGRKLEEFTSAHEYAAFSKTMLATVQENLCGALARHARKVKAETDDGESIQACSMEMLTALGSDDILVIVPGNVALQAAINLCRAFEAGMIQYRSTMSAGVVIAPHNYPMYYLENLAHQLLKSAKQKSRKLNHKATVDFMVIYSQGTVASHVETYRRQLLELPAFGRGDALSADSDVLVLYERPYTLEQLQLLLDWARKLKMEDFPMGQLYTLRSALEQGRMSATFKYLYQLARMKPNERWLFKQFEAEWFAIDKSFVPWAKRITNTGCVKYTTPLADLLELYDFAEGGNAHASDD